MNILIVEGWSDKYTSREAQKRNKTSTSAMSKNLIYYYFKRWMFGENRFFEWRQMYAVPFENYHFSSTL